MEKHFEYTAARRNALKKSLQEKLDEILNTGSKRSIAPSELQLRLNARLRNKLEEDSYAPEAYTIYRQQADQPVEKADLGEIYARIAKKMAEETESAENFENWSAVSVLEMIDDGILKAEEISYDNFMQLARLIHRYKSIFYKIKAVRMNGDYAYEKTFLSELPIVSKTEKDNITSKSSKSNQDIMLEDLINKFCDTQIKDGE